VKANPPIKKRGDEADPQKLIRQSLMRYGADRKEIQAKVLKFLS
jgi:hypothetical protein